MNTQQRLKQALFAFALAGFVAPAAALAQDDPAARSQAAALALEAVTLRDEGKLEEAKAKAEASLALNPADESAQKFITEVKNELAAKAEADDEDAPKTPLDKAAKKNLVLFDEINRAITDARNFAEQGQYQVAEEILTQAEAALPNNIAGQQLRDRIQLVRQDIKSDLNSRNAGGTDALANKLIADRQRSAKENISAARNLMKDSRRLAAARRFDEAAKSLDEAAALLPNNDTSVTAKQELKAARVKLLEARYIAAVEARDLRAAEKHADAVEKLQGNTDRRLLAMRADLEEKKLDPHYRSMNDANPEFVAREKKANDLLVKGRAQYLYGDYQGALDSFSEALQYSPYNTEAKSFQIRIRQLLQEKSGALTREVARGDLLAAVDGGWTPASIFVKDSAPTVSDAKVTEDPVLTKMKSIRIPGVKYSDVTLKAALEDLVIQSSTYDREQKGVNIQLIDPDNRQVPVPSFAMNDLPLNKILEQLLKQVNYSYTINDGIIEVRPSSVGAMENETDEFPFPQSSVTRMTGAGARSAGGAAASPFGGGDQAGADGTNPAEEALKRHFRAHGIDFSQEKGTGLSYNGTLLSVTHNRKALDRIRAMLRRYSTVKMVNIEAKFLEVSQGSLNEIANNWIVKNRNDGRDTLAAASGLRTMDSFRTGSAGRPITITTAATPATAAVTDANGVVTSPAIEGVPESVKTYPSAPPVLPGSAAFGATESQFTGTYTSTFGVGGYDVQLFVRALEQATGSDLMCAPSLSVLDGNTATIKIVQELRYPTSYTETNSNVSGGGGGNWGGNRNNNGNNNNWGGGGGGATITAGTPQDFEMREVGVLMEVAPKVSDDNESIELDLKPKITEFEGFIEYGGMSVAITGQTTITVPSGFYQPVFSVRDVATKVTVFDGATVVIGGLTREEVKTIHDKVPVLGDMPLIGKLFRSDGKSSTKKNLMIFVTAQLISPSGAPAKSSGTRIAPGATFSSPTVITPGGAAQRYPIERGGK